MADGGKHLVSASHGGDTTRGRTLPAQPSAKGAGGARIWLGVASSAERRVETEASTLAATLASGPTRAFGAMRRMLRQSFETGRPDQVEAEKQSIVAASRTDDAREGITAFAAKRRPQFRGE